MKKIGLLALMALFLTPAGQAWSEAYTNFAGHSDTGDMSAGLAVGSLRTTAFFNYGVTEAGTIHAIYGTWFPDGIDEGTEYGVGYWHQFSKGFDVDGSPVRISALAMYRRGSAKIGKSSFDYTQIDLGLAGSMSPATDLEVYGGAIYRMFDTDGGSENDLGFLGGAEYLVMPELALGAEIHIGWEDESISLWAEYMF